MTPTHRLVLGPMDHLLTPVYPPTAFYFSIKPGVSNEAVFAHLQEGLRRTFLQVPWLNGKVYRQAQDTPGWCPGQLEIHYTVNAANEVVPRQIQYKELREATPSTYPDLKARSFPLDAFNDEDLTSITSLDAALDAGVDVVAVQANFMHGACLLCVSVLHAACDATGMGIILNLWADQCRQLGDESEGFSFTLPEESWDRKVIDKIWKNEATGHGVADVNLASWHAIDLDPPKSLKPALSNGTTTEDSSDTPQNTRDMTSKLFYMSPEAFALLLKECTDEVGPDITGNDALMALIWRGLTRARAMNKFSQGLDLDLYAPFEIQVPVDARPSFSRAMSVPPTYTGNLTYHHRPTLPLWSLITNKPGASTALVAQAIHTSAMSISHETMMDGYLLLREMGDYGHKQPPRHATLEGNWFMSSMLMNRRDEAMRFGDQIFGNGGRPEGSRPIMGMSNRAKVPACYILPRKDNGGIEFIVSMFEDEWPYLLEGDGFGRYASLLG